MLQRDTGGGSPAIEPRDAMPAVTGANGVTLLFLLSILSAFLLIICGVVSRAAGTGFFCGPVDGSTIFCCACGVFGACGAFATLWSRCPCAIGDSSFGSLCTRDGGAFGVSTTLGDLGIFGYFPAFFDSTGNFCGTDAPSFFFFFNFFDFFNFFIAPLFFLFCFVTT